MIMLGINFKPLQLNMLRKLFKILTQNGSHEINGMHNTLIYNICTIIYL